MRKKKSRLIEFIFKLFGLSPATLIYNEVNRHKRYLNLSNDEPYKSLIGKKYCLKMNCFYTFSATDLVQLEINCSNDEQRIISEGATFFVKGVFSKLINEKLLLYSHDYVINTELAGVHHDFIVNQLVKSTCNNGYYEFQGFNEECAEEIK